MFKMKLLKCKLIYEINICLNFINIMGYNNIFKLPCICRADSLAIFLYKKDSIILIKFKHMFILLFHLHISHFISKIYKQTQTHIFFFLNSFFSLGPSCIFRFQKSSSLMKVLIVLRRGPSIIFNCILGNTLKAS